MEKGLLVGNFLFWGVVLAVLLAIGWLLDRFLLRPLFGRWTDLFYMGAFLLFALPGGVASRVWPDAWLNGPGQIFMLFLIFLAIPWAISGLLVG